MAKMNTESKRGYTLIVILVIILLACAGIFAYMAIKSHKIVVKIEELLSSEQTSAIYLMREDCTYCVLNKSNMKSVVDEYGFEYYNVDSNDLLSKDLSKVLDLLKIEKFGTPLLVTVGNGEVISSLSGIHPYNELFDYLKENKLISDEAKLYLNYVSYKDYMKLIEKDEPQVFVLATSVCEYCLAEQSVLMQVAKETGAKINYVYLDNIFDSEEEYNNFMNSLSWFNTNNNWGTPTTLIVKNKVVKNYLSGYRAMDEIIEFYTENGVIK